MELSRGSQNAVNKGYATTALWAHVKRFHGDKMAAALTEISETDLAPPPTKKQTTIEQMYEKKTKYDSHDPRATKITYLIAEQICLDMEPLDLVNKLGFRRTISSLAPRFVLFCVKLFML